MDGSMAFSSVFQIFPALSHLILISFFPFRTTLDQFSFSISMKIPQSPEK